MKIGLFFSLGISVELWDRKGMLDREKLLYEKLLDSGSVDEVIWFTYGADDKRYEKSLRTGITIVTMPGLFRGRVGMIAYSLFMPFLHRCQVRRVSILKTNQMRGSWSAVIASMLSRKPLLVRTGYTWSINARREKRIVSLDRIASLIERLTYARADAAVVSSEHDAEYIKRRYRIVASRVHVLGNYVDTDLFKPDPNAVVYNDRMAFVGRLSPEKNLFNLIKAIAGLPYTLDLYYQDDSLRDELQALADRVKSNVRFMGTVRNAELPAVLTRYPLFVLPSLYEGMPKVLLEAMSCGVPVLGTDVQGINAIITHGVTGWLAEGVDSGSLREGITVMMSERSLREKMGTAARSYIKDKFSLMRIVDEETAIYSELQGVPYAV